MAEQQLRVKLLALTAGFNRNIKDASARLNAFGAQAQRVSASLRTIQIPLALAGGAAIKMAADFDRSMTMIESLVGIAGAEVDAMAGKVRSMASEIGVSSNQAAEALFFITSAGLRGSEAMDVLEASMKAAAVGLGETKTVADLATSAMNAYGSETLSASMATDVMVSAVREGKLEASELAGSMGRVLPVASAMGVRFDEVGAAFAALSRTGTNAAEAATQIRGILTSLLKPTKEASDTLAEMGLNTEILRRQIKEEGLLAALETLKRNFDGNDEAAQRVFGNVRALSGIMDLLGANVQTTRDIFDRMTQSTGATDKAFQSLQQSAEFKLRKSINEVKNSFTETGAVILDALLPHIQSLSESITKLFENFRDLDKDTQKSIITLGEIIIVAPFVVSAIGTITGAVNGLVTALRVLGGASLAKPLAALAAVLSLQGDERADLFSEVMLQAELALAAEDRYTESLEGQEEQANATAAALDNLLKPLAKTQEKLSQIGTGKAVDPKELFSDLLDQEDLNNANELANTIDLMTRFDLAEASASVEYFGNSLKMAAEGAREPLEEVTEMTRKLSETAVNFLMQVGRSLQSAFMSMFNGKGVIESLGEAILNLVKQLAAASIAAAILSAIISSLTGKPFAATFPLVFQGLTGINTASPTGIPGGNSQSPFNQPQVNISGQFRLDGQDLVLAVQRAQNTRNSFT
jgi:TP901 family phage tail tape measure protein